MWSIPPRCCDQHSSGADTGAATEHAFMRQSPLLSLCLGGLLGVAFASCGGNGVQPIGEASNRASGATDDPTSAGGNPDPDGSREAGGHGGAASGGRTEAQGGVLDGDYGGSAGDMVPGNGGTPSSGGTGGAAGNSGHAGSPDVVGVCSIAADPDGWVRADSNDCGVRGPWYSYSDCTTSPENCTENLTPAEDEPFAPDGGRMCTGGTTTPISNAEDFDVIWGAGIGLSLNQAASDAPRGTIGELPQTLIGFSFSVVGTTVPAELRILFPTPITERIEHFETITSGAGVYEVTFDGLAQGDWVTSPTQLDSTEVTAIQFHVPAKTDEAVPFDYCIENLHALY